jgi:hypothetical protein
MGRTCSTYVKMRNAYTIAYGETEGKRLLGLPRSRWKDNMIIYLKETGCKD